MPPFATPHLVLGGARSGKSGFAEGLIHMLPPPYVYVATAQPLDHEMEQRIRQHRERRGPNWETIETPLDLPARLASLNQHTRPVLVDCLTLWLTNLVSNPTAPISPEPVVADLCAAVAGAAYPLVLVANEVGTGIVPENRLARTFRDLAGWANQEIAAVCAGATLVVAGLPLTLKGTC